MKTILLSLLILCLAANFATAGDDNTPKTKDGDKAWLFSLGGLSNLGAGDFNGGVGGKYYTSEGTAIRLAIGVATSSTTIKYTGAANPAAADETVSGSTFSITPAYLHVLSSSGPVAPYIGLQAGVAWATSTDQNPGFVNNNKNHNSTTTFGVAALAGVEWFAWSNISFGAEYQLGFSSTTGTHEVTVGAATTSTDLPSNTSFSLASASSGNLTLSVYW